MVFERPKELAAELKKSNGRAVVLMHPWYDLPLRTEDPEEFNSFANDIKMLDLQATAFRNDSASQAGGNNGIGKDYDLVVHRVFSKSKLPVIVFEENRKLAQTRELLNELGIKRVFLVATKKGCPAPVVKWQNVLGKLRELGLKHAIVGGQYLSIAEGLPKQRTDFFVKKNLGKLKPNYCVGALINKLIKANFKTSVMPNAVYPQWQLASPKLKLKS